LLAQLRRPWRSLQRTRPHKAEQMWGKSVSVFYRHYTATDACTTSE
jgi:hypothetical protein